MLWLPERQKAIAVLRLNNQDPRAKPNGSNCTTTHPRKNEDCYLSLCEYCRPRLVMIIDAVES